MTFGLAPEVLASNRPRENRGRGVGDLGMGLEEISPNPQSPTPNPPNKGAVAQLGERLICTQEVAGSIPTSSTRVVHGPVAQLARAHP